MKLFIFGVGIGALIGLMIGVYLGAKIIDEKDSELKYLRKELAKAAYAERKVISMTYITDDIMLTKHFDSSEFKCTCGCNTIKIDKLFVERMEKMFIMLEKVVPLKAIIINSGYRCNNCSARISGAFVGDMHNKGAAADLHAITADNKRVDCFTLAEAAQRVGFGGIAIITDTDIHIDDRQRAEFEYSNRQWYGNEAIGGTYPTFIGKSKYTKQFDTKDDEKYIELIIDNVKYTGYLKKS